MGTDRIVEAIEAFCFNKRRGTCICLDMTTHGQHTGSSHYSRDYLRIVGIFKMASTNRFEVKRRYITRSGRPHKSGDQNSLANISVSTKDLVSTKMFEK